MKLSLSYLMDNTNVAPGPNTYTLRKVKGQEDTGEVSVSKKSVEFVGGVKGMARRLIAVYNAMPEPYRQIGWHWYDDANGLAVDLADTYNFSSWQTAQVISVLSPQNPWDGRRNKAGERISDGNRLCALNVVKSYVEGGADLVRKLRGWGYAPDFIAKAIAVLEGKELDWSGAPKTYDFACLIFDPKRLDIAVCDSHASRIATGNLGGRYHVIAKAAYGLIRKAYLLAARVLGIPAHVLQSSTWQFAVDGGLY